MVWTAVVVDWVVVVVVTPVVDMEIKLAYERLRVDGNIFITSRDVRAG